MNFNSILIITYGRSGSTLLQGVLNGIDGYVIRGENSNLFFHFYQAYQAILNSKTYGQAVQANHPWYGNQLMNERQFIHQLRGISQSLLLEDKIGERVSCYGFKEIRYHFPDVQDNFYQYLNFLEIIFPNVCFIFNTRNLESVMKSGFWSRQSEAKRENNLKLLIELEKKFHHYASKYPGKSYHVTYEDIVSRNDNFKKMFDFLGENYERVEVEKVLSVNHSSNSKTIKSKYNPAVISRPENNNN